MHGCTSAKKTKTERIFKVRLVVRGCTDARMHGRTHRRKDKKTKTKRNKIKVSKTQTHRRTDAYKEVYKLL